MQTSQHRYCTNTTTLHSDCLRKGGKEAGTVCAVVLNTQTCFYCLCYTTAYTEKDIFYCTVYALQSKSLLCAFSEAAFQFPSCLSVTLSLVNCAVPALFTAITCTAMSLLIRQCVIYIFMFAGDHFSGGGKGRLASYELQAVSCRGRQTVIRETPNRGKEVRRGKRFSC